MKKHLIFLKRRCYILQEKFALISHTREPSSVLVIEIQIYTRRVGQSSRGTLFALNQAICREKKLPGSCAFNYHRALVPLFA